MLRFVSLVLLVLAVVGFTGVHAQDKKAAPIKIAWYGQSFFNVVTPKGTSIVFDPHQIPEYGRVMGLKADIIFMSHLHNDHTQVYVCENVTPESVKKKEVTIIAGLKGTQKNSEWNNVDEEIKDVKIRSVPLYHDGMEGMRYGKNTAFVLEFDGWKICHLGDVGHLLTPAQIRRIGPIDVLMIPVGGIYTVNGSEAKQIVEQLKPKEYIFPMHCGTKIYTELLPTDEFLEDIPKERIANSDDNFILLNRDKQRPRPLIVQLQYAPRDAPKEKEKEKGK